MCVPGNRVRYSHGRLSALNGVVHQGTSGQGKGVDPPLQVLRAVQRAVLGQPRKTSRNLRVPGTPGVPARDGEWFLRDRALPTPESPVICTRRSVASRSGSQGPQANCPHTQRSCTLLGSDHTATAGTQVPAKRNGGQRGGSSGRAEAQTEEVPNSHGIPRTRYRGTSHLGRRSTAAR